MTTSEDVIRAAASVGRDVAEARLSPASLDQAVAEECRSLFGTVVGEGDPLFEVQIDVARQVLERGGITVEELDEWAAVLRRRVGEVTDPQTDVPPVSGSLRPDSAAPETDADTPDQGEEVPHDI